MLTNYLDHQLSAFRKNFEIALKTQGIREVHKLRLSIKKLRTAFTLTEIASNGEFKKQDHSELFDGLFQKAGELRELHINLSIIGKSNVSQSRKFIKLSTASIKKTGAQLKKQMRNFDLKKLNQLDSDLLNVARSLDDTELINTGKYFLLTQYKLVAAHMLRPGKHVKLHKLRIYLKTMLEVLIVLRKLDRTSALKELKQDCDTLNKIIGRWHDHVVLLNFLEKSAKEIHATEHSSPPDKWIRRIGRKQTALKEQSLERLRLFIVNHPEAQMS